MLKKSLKYAKIALLNTGNEDFLGYKQVLEQEKIPFEIVDSFKTSYDLLIMPEESIVYSDIFKAVFNGMNLIMTNHDEIHGYKSHGSGMIYNFEEPFAKWFVKNALGYHCRPGEGFQSSGEGGGYQTFQIFIR